MKKYTFLILTFLTFNLLNAQELLNHGYNYGTLPTNAKESDVALAYTTWKNTYTESCGDDRIRVKFDAPNENQTVSEGIGYGMLIAAYIGDQDLLDGLWNYYNYFLNENGVMHWKIDGCSSVFDDGITSGYNGATDAELDAAMALIIADKKWGSNGTINYSEDASNLISVIKTHEVESGTNVLKPGDMWGGSENTNISYFSPGYYRAYKEQTNDNSWDDVASKSYEIIALNQSVNNAVHNLVSDWCKADGSFSEVVDWATNQGQSYSYDAGRTPWRIAIDYLWYGNTDALAYSNKCIDFINAKNGLDNIYPGYYLDGTAFITSYKDVTFTGAYATAAMASTDQNFVNDAYTKVVEMTTDAYFGSTLRVMYLLTLSGNFYSPEKFATSLNTDDNIIDKETLPYPNPVDDFLQVQLNQNNTSNKVEIHNLSGKLIITKTYSNKEETANLDVALLETGIYLVTINNTHKYKVIKN